MKDWIKLILLILIVGFISLFAFKFERWFNYKFGYEQKIEEKIRPLEKRVEQLERNK